MVAPQYEALSGKYPDVLFTKVVQDNNPEICETEGKPMGETDDQEDTCRRAERLSAYPSAVETCVLMRFLCAAIRAFPTFRFYHNGQLLEEVRTCSA